MKQFFQRVWKEDEGVLSFEWILLTTLLTIGVIGGIVAIRDTIIDEFGDIAQAYQNLDQSYIILDPQTILVHDDLISGAANSSFLDSQAYEDCFRTPIAPQQAAMDDGLGS